MKKIAFLLVISLFLISNQAFAGNGELFSYDKNKVETEMADLTMLENRLISDQTLNFEQLLLSNDPLIMNLDYENNLIAPGMGAGPIIPSFWWGCLTGPLGVLIVYLYEEDRAETKSAIWGCIIWAILTGGAGWGWFYR